MTIGPTLDRIRVRLSNGCILFAFTWVSRVGIQTGGMCVVPRSTRRLAHVSALALLGVMGLALVPRPAMAIGCQVQDRPALGLGLSMIREASEGLGFLRAEVSREAGSRLMPKPCTGDVPTTSNRPVSVSSMVDGVRLASPTGSGTRRFESPSTLGSPRHHSSRLDRPPRLPARWD